MQTVVAPHLKKLTKDVLKFLYVSNPRPEQLEMAESFITTVNHLEARKQASN